MFNHLSIRVKLVSGILFIAGILGFIGIFGILNTKGAADRDTFLYEKMTLPLGQLNAMTGDFLRGWSLVQKYFVATDPAELSGIDPQLLAYRQDFARQAEGYTKTYINADDKRNFDKYRDLMKKVDDTEDQILALARTGDMQNALALLHGAGAQALKDADDWNTKVVAMNVDSARDLAASNASTAQMVILVMVLVVAAGFGLALFIGLGLAFSITRPLVAVARGLEAMAEGDFPMSVLAPGTLEKLRARGDELGSIGASLGALVLYVQEKESLAEQIAGGDLRAVPQVAGPADGFGKAFVQMVGSLNSLVGQVRTSVDQVASGSNQVASASQSLSQGATVQASSLEEVSATSNEVHGHARRNAENAHSANLLARQAAVTAEEGNRKMEALLGRMDALSRSSEETKKIVKAIDDIAFQVNLLALNANVEAARAGKFGKGFAVVADEVRNLAIRSAAAVKETTLMVEGSIRGISEVSGQTKETAGQLGEIQKLSSQVAGMLDEIAAESRDQARALGQVSGGLEQIDQVTQANTASAEESAAAAEELSGQALQLRDVVSRFQLLH